MSSTSWYNLSSEKFSAEQIILPLPQKEGWKWTVKSFELGWRKVPVHVERQSLFLQALKRGVSEEARRCWDIRGCPSQIRGACPAWEFNAGHLCWFINGTICEGKAQESWPQKMKVCRKCEVFAGFMKRT